MLAATQRRALTAWITGPFRVDTSSTALMRAQFAAFSRQIPLLYFMLCVNGVALAFAYRNIAPASLTWGVATGLMSVCGVRLVVWLRSRNRTLSDAALAKRLKGTRWIGAVIGVSFLSWAVALFPYGTDRAQDQATFFVGITAISCTFCLMHLRGAALLLASIVVIPFTLFLFSTGDTNLISIGLNLILVSVAMVYMLVVASRDFARLVSSQIEARRLSDDNARLANIDALTELPNRRQFFAELNRALENAQATGEPFVVGVVDLDGFKPVNDRFGHVVGDQVLTEAGARLRAQANPATFVGRLGGDEFGVIIAGRPDDADLLAWAEELCTALRIPYQVSGLVANISASLGFAAFPEGGDSASTLYEHADYALYHAKGHKRGQPVVFSAAHAAEIRAKTITEHCLRGADLEAEMSLHFQPVYDVGTKRPVAFEALARWNSPELGLVSPGVFIPIAERTELITQITRCLLRKALVAARAWPEHMRLSFNLSARDIVSPEAVLRIIAIIENSGITPARIDLEVTETSVVTDFEQARTSLLLLKALGVKISLDDFGTGYSSLSHVHRLPLDKIKIDRSFVQDIETQDLSQNLIKSVIDLCGNLHMECVIEGMETARQAEILEDLGCTTMQGYFFGKPLPEDQVLGLIAAGTPETCHPAPETCHAAPETGRAAPHDGAGARRSA